MYGRGPQVLEAPFKQLRSPRVVHAATHGFFLSDLEMPAAEPSEAVAFGHEPRSRLTALGVTNPMLRSGLALAGSQSWLQRKPVPEDAEDWLLTAADVSTMDLRATDLVVLSACDTGRHGGAIPLAERHPPLRGGREASTRNP